MYVPGLIEPGRFLRQHQAAGMFYIIRLADSRLILIDGGWESQSTEKSVPEALKFLYEISGTPAGEKVKIALAVTLGLADVKARRAGVQLGMLFIDEPPFLDADGTDAYADALTAMAARNPNMRILAISHDPTMKARFPQNITVKAGENGSTVTME